MQPSGALNHYCCSEQSNAVFLRHRQIHSDSIDIWRDGMEAPYSKIMEMHLRSLGLASEHGLSLFKQMHFRWCNDKTSRSCKNWVYRAKDHFNEFGK